MRAIAKKIRTGLKKPPLCTNPRIMSGLSETRGVRGGTVSVSMESVGGKFPFVRHPKYSRQVFVYSFCNGLVPRSRVCGGKTLLGYSAYVTSILIG